MEGNKSQCNLAFLLTEALNFTPTAIIQSPRTQVGMVGVIILHVNRSWFMVSLNDKL